MKIRKTVPGKDNLYFKVKSYGGYSDCIQGNPDNRPYPGSVLANCVGDAVGIVNEQAGQENCDLIGNLYPRAMKGWAERHGWKVSKAPTPGGLLLWYGENGKEHVVNCMKKSGLGYYITESGWNFSKGNYQQYRKVTKVGNYGRSRKYKYQGCIQPPFINPYWIPDKKVIKKGMKGDPVRWMQWVLNYEGCYGKKADSNVDGSFGSKTLEALKVYQKAHGLEVDGKCGPKTQKVMRAAYSLED